MAWLLLRGLATTPTGEGSLDGDTQKARNKILQVLVDELEEARMHVTRKHGTCMHSTRIHGTCMHGT